jgi:hypothetical protein
VLTFLSMMSLEDPGEAIGGTESRTGQRVARGAWSPSIIDAVSVCRERRAQFCKARMRVRKPDENRFVNSTNFSRTAVCAPSH